MTKHNIILIIGLIITILSIFALYQPRQVLSWILKLNPKIRYIIAMVIRAVFGILLIYAADISKYAIIVYIIGLLLIASAIFIFFLGPGKMTQLLEKYSQQQSLIAIQTSCVISIIIGLLLLFCYSVH